MAPFEILLCLLRPLGIHFVLQSRHAGIVPRGSEPRRSFGLLVAPPDHAIDEVRDRYVEMRKRLRQRALRAPKRAAVLAVERRSPPGRCDGIGGQRGRGATSSIAKPSTMHDTERRWKILPFFHSSLRPPAMAPWSSWSTNRRSIATVRAAWWRSFRTAVCWRSARPPLAAPHWPPNSCGHTGSGTHRPC